MGLAITEENFTAEDYQRFMQKVRLDLEVLQQVVSREGFGEGETTIGAEVEFYIVDQAGRVNPINQTINERLADPLLTVELNRFNLEYNLSPQVFSGSPFKKSEKELVNAVSAINQLAKPLDGKLVSIGILPTLTEDNFSADMMTDTPRYHVLSKILREQRGGPFEIHIRGEDRLAFKTDEVTLEGANTSFQLHWRVPTARFADYYNALQLVTPLAVALGANSPSLFQKNLWDETRVALFTQSIDSRSPDQKTWRYPPRVYFGHGWLRQAWQAFAGAASLYPPLIPIVGEEDPVEILQTGGIPELAELKLHHGTTWPWNRAVYDHHHGGHLRIEMRALPAGPTPIDMSANGLFLIGCALALKDQMERVVSVMPFSYAEHNFYRAAKFGMQADLIWPGKSIFEMCDRTVVDIVNELLPRAEAALSKTALDSAEIERLFAVIKGRLETRQSGAQWQRRMIAHYPEKDRYEASKIMLDKYMQNSEKGLPVHEWSLARV